MAEYQLTATEVIVRTEDGANIPADPDNVDYNEYLWWLEDGGVPDPYIEPEPEPPEPTTEQSIAYDHENRIRALEGQPPLNIMDFLGKFA